MGPKFSETAYISEINRARNLVKSDAQVATNNNSDPMQNFSLGVAGEDGAPNSKFFKLPELAGTSRTRKLIFGLQVNIDELQISRYPVDDT